MPHATTQPTSTRSPPAERLAAAALPHARRSTIATRMQAEPSVGEIVCADYDMRAAQELEKSLSKAKAVKVDVSGATTLELLTLDGGDGIGGDHGDWAEAQLLR